MAISGDISVCHKLAVCALVVKARDGADILQAQDNPHDKKYLAFNDDHAEAEEPCAKPIKYHVSLVKPRQAHQASASPTPCSGLRSQILGDGTEISCCSGSSQVGMGLAPSLAKGPPKTGTVFSSVSPWVNLGPGAPGSLENTG